MGKLARGMKKIAGAPGHSPDHAALILAAGDDYACFSGDLLHSPRQFTIEHDGWLPTPSSPVGRLPPAGDRRRTPSSSADGGWLEEDKQGDYRWREAGQQAADKGKQ
jgi:hypothetical protein